MVSPLSLLSPSDKDKEKSREEEARQAAAARLDFLLADAVDELDEEVKVEGEAVADKGKGKADLADSDADDDIDNDIDNLPPITAEAKQMKRWSRAPILPELDFASSSSSSESESSSSLLSNHGISALGSPPTSKPSAATATDAIATLISSSPFTAITTTSDPTNSPISTQTYRVDIQAPSSASYQSIESTCQELVLKAGGRIINAYYYFGGFLYSLPANTVSPIRTCELPAHEVKVQVSKWAAFPEPKFNGLKMHPPGRVKNRQLGGPVAKSGEGKTRTLHRKGSSRHMNLKKLVESEGVSMVVEGSEHDKENAPDGKQEEVGKAAENGAANDSHDSASVASKNTVKGKCLPNIGSTLKLKSVKSQELLRRVGSRAGGSVSQLASPSSLQSTHSNASHATQRFTVVASSVDDSDDESGAEEWESVRSELTRDT